ncbi:MAG: endospore germination permease [Ectobacillus sp.]
MSKIKINTYELFVLIVLFELGSAIVVPLGGEAKQDVWLSILLGMLGGFVLFFVYFRLFQYYPDKPFIGYIPEIVGAFFGRLIGMIYIIYFLYISARVLRDFGAFLVNSAYRETPLFTIMLVMMVTIMYTIRNGFEVLARVGELLFIFTYFLFIIGAVFLLASGAIDLNNLKPVLVENVSKVVQVAATETLYVPFGEMVVFTMILPYVDNGKKVKMGVVLAIALSGLSIAFAAAINVATLGTDITIRSTFPLLSTIQHIQVANFLERLDVLFMITLIVGMFFKISIFFYGGLVGVASLFRIEETKQLVYPLGLIVLMVAMGIAGNFIEHIKEGLDFVPMYLHLPLQVIVPFILFVFAFFQQKRRSKTG